MSFAAETKTELCRQACEQACCKRALCYGMLLFAKQFSLKSIAFTTEHRETAVLFADLLAEQMQVVSQLSSKMTRRAGNPVASTVTVPYAQQREQLLTGFGYTGHEVSLRILPQLFHEPGCTAAFLRGAFLSCGTVTNPAKEYHLEFAVPYMNLAKDLQQLLAQTPELAMQPSVIGRKGSFVVYSKDSQGIENLLTFMGAVNASMELMQVKMLKEMRNQINRKTNFETANIDKTVSASAKQIEAIEAIAQTVGLHRLSPQLQELAQLRLEHPELSLRELGQRLSEPISRSGVNHRLNRILAFAEEINQTTHD